jgi:hypothetical protein
MIGRTIVGLGGSGGTIIPSEPTQSFDVTITNDDWTYDPLQNEYFFDYNNNDIDTSSMIILELLTQYIDGTIEAEQFDNRVRFFLIGYGTNSPIPEVVNIRMFLLGTGGGSGGITGPITVDDIEADGTPSSTTYLRGDGVWAEVVGGGAVPPHTHTLGDITDVGSIKYLEEQIFVTPSNWIYNYDEERYEINFEIPFLGIQPGFNLYVELLYQDDEEDDFPTFQAEASSTPNFIKLYMLEPEGTFFVNSFWELIVGTTNIASKVIRIEDLDNVEIDLPQSGETLIYDDEDRVWRNQQDFSIPFHQHSLNQIFDLGLNTNVVRTYELYPFNWQFDSEFNRYYVRTYFAPGLSQIPNPTFFIVWNDGLTSGFLGVRAIPFTDEIEIFLNIGEGIPQNIIRNVVIRSNNLFEKKLSLSQFDFSNVAGQMFGVPNGSILVHRNGVWVPSTQVPILNGLGQLDPSVLPPLAITNTFVVNSQQEMGNLEVQLGDVAIRTDLNKTFIFSSLTDGPSVMTSWTEIISSGGVTSINGMSGNVFLDADDVGALNSNDGRIVNWNEAYSWGNHALADYLQEVTISDIIATGTPSSSTYLRGDGVWAAVSGGGTASTFIAPTPPPSPGPGDLWWDTNTARLKIYYFDGDSSQWVDATPVAGVGQLELSDLTDVNIATPQPGTVLTYDGDEWVAEPVQEVVETNTFNKISFWTGTQAQYDALPVKDADTLYFIN